MSLDPAEALKRLAAAAPSARTSAVAPPWLLGGAGSRGSEFLAPHVAAFTLEALARWPLDAPGTRVAGAEALWRAAQPGGAAAAVSAWLMPGADAATWCAQALASE